MAKDSEELTGGNRFYKFFTLAAVPGIFILHNINYFRNLLFTFEVYWLASAYLLLPFGLYIFFHWLLKQTKDRSLFVSILIALLFFFFGAAQDLFIRNSITKVIGKTYVLPILFLAPVFYVLLKRPNITFWLRGLTFSLHFFFLSEFLLLLLSIPNFNQQPTISNLAVLKNTQAKTSEQLNVHHIIFDGYTNSNTLRKLFNFKNPLDSFLKKEGFYIAGKTKSNYNFTPYSLAATLNLQYLNLNEKQLARDYKNYLLGAKVYQENSIFRFFEKEQYTSSHFAIVDNTKHLDKLGTFVPKTPRYSLRYQTLERIVMNPWLWQKAIRSSKETIPSPVKESLRYYAQYNFQAQKHALAFAPEPNFRFTQFLLPHEPYAFSKGSLDSLQLSDLMDHGNGYIKQVEYANNLIVNLVSELKRNDRNIIILQGDHGFRNYDFSRFSPFMQNETLNAFYFPDQNYTLLYDSISLVNTYRVVLNQYFHQNLPLIKDSAIIPLE
ncbi:MAG: hypothetical protein EOO46_08090 [Flavobacterium sp.]|nr:MAG: hypothetical protein EOO46_08090 [Flavobacterium sp.]